MVIHNPVLIQTIMSANNAENYVNILTSITHEKSPWLAMVGAISCLWALVVALTKLLPKVPKFIIP